MFLGKMREYLMGLDLQVEHLSSPVQSSIRTIPCCSSSEVSIFASLYTSWSTSAIQRNLFMMGGSASWLVFCLFLMILLRCWKAFWVSVCVSLFSENSSLAFSTVGFSHSVYFLRKFSLNALLGCEVSEVEV